MLEYYILSLYSKFIKRLNHIYVKNLIHYCKFQASIQTHRGQQFAEQMMQSNPEVIDRLRKNMAENLNTNQQQPPTNDDKEN